MKRTEPFHGPHTGGFQRDVVADDIGNIYPLADLVNIGTPDATSHESSLVPRPIKQPGYPQLPGQSLVPGKRRLVGQ